MHLQYKGVFSDQSTFVRYNNYTLKWDGIGKVAIRGAVFNIVGNVCMDMVMVAPNPAEETDGISATVVIGDTAVLWGPFEDDQGEGLVRLQDVSTTLKT
jgi:alanine racemase